MFGSCSLTSVTNYPHVRGRGARRELNHAGEGELPVLVLPVPDGARPGAVDEPAARGRPVLPPDFQRHLVEVLDLEHLARLPIPHDDRVAHVFGGDRVAAEVMRVRPAGRDHAVQLGLHADVVHVAWIVGAIRGGERRHEVPLLIEPDQCARTGAVLRPEHRDHHAARYGVIGVRARVPADGAQVGNGLDDRGMAGVGLDVVDKQPVRDQPAREDAVGIHGVAEVVCLVVDGRARGNGREDLSVARRLGIGVDHREKVRLFRVGVTGPDIQQGFALVRSQVLHEH